MILSEPDLGKSVRFWSKEQGTRVKDGAKNGVSKQGRGGALGTLYNSIFERHMSTRSKAFSTLKCVGVTKFELLSVLTFRETNCTKFWQITQSKDAKSPLPVHHSKTSLLISFLHVCSVACLCITTPLLITIKNDQAIPRLAESFSVHLQ